MSTPTDYIGATDYDTLVVKLRELVAIHDDLLIRSEASRKLRYAEIDIEEGRSKGTIAPDELIIPQHIIHSNIQKEQSAYIQYVTQSPRAVILQDEFDANVDLSLLENDLTKKLRFPGWQLGMYSNIDSFQANGYSVMEVVYDKNQPGHLAHEQVQYEDFAFIADTRDLQAVEMTSRKYYFTRTKLKELAGDTEDDFNPECVEKLIGQEPTADSITSVSAKDASLFKIYKNMFRVQGTVFVAWSMPGTLDTWLRAPRPLYVGRRQPKTITSPMQAMLSKIKTATTGIPESENGNETQYPYFLYPYTISEDSTIGNLRGRVFLDQDVQEAVTSIMSALVTKTRRSSGLYFAREDGDPNASILMDKNIAFKSGAILNGKIREMKIDAPDAMLFGAIQQIVSANQAETSQVNFAENNRQGDSRKTAAAVKSAERMQQQLSTVQVVLFSLALQEQYAYCTEIIKSRVLSGLVKVNPELTALYSRSFIVKPSGDSDVIERQQMVSLMQQAWPVVQNTPLNQAFLVDLVKLMFPNSASKYQTILQQAAQQAQQQQQSVQAQQQQQGMAMLQQSAQEFITLASHPEYFSDAGKVNALPKLKDMKIQIEQMQKNGGQ